MCKDMNDRLHNIYREDNDIKYSICMERNDILHIKNMSYLCRNNLSSSMGIDNTKCNIYKDNINNSSIDKTLDHTFFLGIILILNLQILLLIHHSKCLTFYFISYIY